ncbi:hypothetical protein LJC29_07070 [Bacteroides sp. OttesenSCG-928-N06]|nr:hypothetical protein [Bacteroides sp. OttesenSCG-928-N06]
MKKKIIIIIIAILTLLGVGKRVYWYIKSDFNNLFITICNDKAMMGVDNPSRHLSIKLHIDDKLVYKNDSLSMPYEFTKYKVGIGRHKLEIVIDSFSIHKTYFWVIPMDWMIIEYPIYSEKENILITNYLSPPGLE